jgi:branched-chain amino acid transport system ATP-binding protein
LPLLQVEEVSVRFGGVMANQGVNLAAEVGRITGLIGPNGAGKTTMFNVITGLQEPTEGRVKVDGKDVTSLKPHRRARLGLARTFQRLEVFGSLSAHDNVLVAAEIRRRWARDGSDPKAIAEQILERVGITHVANERVDAMPTGMARLVELARALAAQPRLLLLDEPGSGLDESETEGFGDLLLELAREGLGMLLVEHDVDLVMRVCDIIYVLDFGRIIAVGTPTEIQQNPDVQAAYLGAEDPEDADQAAAHTSEVIAHS